MLRTWDVIFGLKNVEGKISPAYHGKCLFLMLWSCNLNQEMSKVRHLKVCML